MASNSAASHICVWEHDGKIFRSDLLFIHGRGRILSPLAGKKVIEASKISDVDTHNMTLRLVQCSRAESRADGKRQEFLLLQTNKCEIGSLVDRILYFGPLERYELGLVDTIEIDEDFIDTSGMKRIHGKPESGNAITAAPLQISARDSYVLFEGNDQFLAISARDVVTISLPTEVEAVALVSENALGYLRLDHEIVPVFNLMGSGLDAHRIIVTRDEGVTFGFPVRRVFDLGRDLELQDEVAKGGYFHYAGKQWYRVVPSDIREGTSLQSVSQGYRNVFTSTERVTEGPTSGPAKAMVLINIGEKLCVPIELIQGIEIMPFDFDRSSLEYLFLGRKVRFFQARSYYGIKPGVSETAEQKVMILKRGDTWIAVAIQSVDSIVFLSEQSIVGYGTWMLNEMSPQFRRDVGSPQQARLYHDDSIFNMMTVSFDSMFQSVQTGD